MPLGAPARSWSGRLVPGEHRTRGCRSARRYLPFCRSWWVSVASLGRCSLDAAQVLVELVEPFSPDPPVLLDPADGRVEHLPLQVTGPELGAPGSRDEPAALEHLQVLGDAGKG